VLKTDSDYDKPSTWPTEASLVSIVVLLDLTAADAAEVCLNKMLLEL